ncbi:MAG: hypothetical protein RSB41_02045 [Bacilli bacterium]
MKKLENNTTTKDDIKRDTIKLVVMGGIILVLFLIVMISNRFNNNGKVDKLNTPNTVLKPFIDKIGDNYNIVVNIVRDGKAVKVQYDRVGKDMLGSKIYLDNKINFIYYNNLFYVINNNVLEKKDNINMFENEDLYFTSYDNFKSLLNSCSKTVSIKEENYDIKRCYVNIDNVLKSYNALYNKNYNTVKSGNVIIDIKTGKEVSEIFIDAKVLDSVIGKSSTTLNYTLTYSNFGKINISNITSLIK